MQRILAAAVILCLTLTACTSDIRFVSAHEGETVTLGASDGGTAPALPPEPPLMLAGQAQDTGPFLSQTETEFTALLNRRRVRQGLHALRRDKTLDNAACLRAAEMLHHQYFGHRRPDGQEWFTVLENEFPYTLSLEGENLALAAYQGSAVTHQSAQDWFLQWESSPPHRENMFNPDYSLIGVGIVWAYQNGSYASIAVTLFGAP